MRAATLWMAVFCAALLIQSAARAESKPTDPIRFSVNAMGYWTDNRDSWETSDKQSTWDFYVTPKVDAMHHGEQTWLDFYYAPSYRYRSNPSDIQNDTLLEHDLGLKIRQDFSPRLEGRLFEKFDYSDDPSIDKSGSQVRGDLTYYLNRAEVGLIHDMTRHAKVDISVRNMIKRYTDKDAASESDEDRTDGGVILYGDLSPTLALVVLANYANYGFSSKFGLDRDFDAALGAIGLEKIFTQSLRGGAKAGAQSVQYKDKGLDSQVSPYGELWLKGWTIPSTMLALDLTHGVREADAYPFASQEYTDLRGDMEWAMTESKRFILNLTGVYRISHYSGSQDLPPSIVQAIQNNPDLAFFLSQIGLQDSGDVKTIEEEIGVTYRMTETSSLKFTQRYEDVNSEVGVSYTKNAFSLALTKQF